MGATRAHPADPPPLVSFIMPIWKPKAEWIATALRSVLDDETCAVEIIAVDDGNVPPVELPVADPRLRLISVPHGGPYAARNAGLMAASGSHVRFVDADDVVVAGSTTRLLELLGDRDDVIAYGATEMCDETLQPTRLVTEHLEGDVADACLLGSFDVYHVSMLFPRSVVNRVGPWDPKFGVSGDWDYVLRALEVASAVRLDEVVTKYRRNSGSVMGRARLEDGLEAHQRVIRRYADRHASDGKQTLIRRATGRLYVDAASAHAWRGERQRAVRLMVRAAGRTPVAAVGASMRLMSKRFRPADPTR